MKCVWASQRVSLKEKSGVIHFVTPVIQIHQVLGRQRRPNTDLALSEWCTETHFLINFTVPHSINVSSQFVIRLLYQILCINVASNFQFSNRPWTTGLIDWFTPYFPFKSIFDLCDWVRLQNVSSLTECEALPGTFDWRTCEFFGNLVKWRKDMLFLIRTCSR